MSQNALIATSPWQSARSAVSGHAPAAAGWTGDNVDEESMAEYVKDALETMSPDPELPRVYNATSDALNGRVFVEVDDGTSFTITVVQT